MSLLLGTYVISVEIMGPVDLNDFLDNFWSMFGQFLTDFLSVFSGAIFGCSFWGKFLG